MFCFGQWMFSIYLWLHVAYVAWIYCSLVDMSTTYKTGFAHKPCSCFWEGQAGKEADSCLIEGYKLIRVMLVSQKFLGQIIYKIIHVKNAYEFLSAGKQLFNFFQSVEYPSRARTSAIDKSDWHFRELFIIFLANNVFMVF